MKDHRLLKNIKHNIVDVKKSMTTSNTKAVNNIKAIGAVLVACVFAVGCYNAEEWKNIENLTVNHSMVNVKDYNTFDAYAKKAANQLMRVRVEIARNQAAYWADKYSHEGIAVDQSADEPMYDDTSISEGSDADNGSSEYCETNNQEKGVDEADLVKTDGQYIYTLHNGELVIVNVLEDGQMSQAGRADVGGYAEEMFIYDDTAVVFSVLPETDVPEEIKYKTQYGSYNNDPAGDDMKTGDMEEGSMGMECWEDWCHENMQYAQMAILDISDKNEPTIIRTVIYAGQYVTARRIEDSVRLIIYSPLPALEMRLNYNGNDYDYTSVDSINNYYSNIIINNENRINALDTSSVVPKKFDSSNTKATPIVDYQDIWGSQTPSGLGLSTIVSLDLSNPSNPETEVSVFGGKGIIYASKKALYLSTSRDYVSIAIQSGLWPGENLESSGIHKFDITSNDSAALYLATGAVKGRLLNQFCMGEKDNFLRVATTTGSAWGNDNSGTNSSNTLDNHVFVLKQQGNELVITGQLDGLGKEEEIYAARFLGDRGFLVTYLQTDPLFTLDMSDPYNPKVIGEWIGPGYSTYLHPFGENSIVSVGIQDWRVAISLYNISDFADPTLVTRLLFPNDNLFSSAISDHKAITVNEETGFLALPFMNMNYLNYETGIYTYNVNETEIKQNETLALTNELNRNEGYAIRSLYIDDYMYGLSRCRITSAPLDNPENIVDTIPLFTAGSCDDLGHYIGW